MNRGRSGGVVSGGTGLAVLALVLVVGCTEAGTPSLSTSPSQSSPVTSDAVAFCSDLRAAQNESKEQTKTATGADLIYGLQRVAGQAVPVLENDSEGLSGAMALDAQAVISALDAMATTHNPADFMKNLKAVNSTAVHFVHEYC